MSNVEAAVQAIKDKDAEGIRSLLSKEPGLPSAKTAQGVSVLTTAAYYGRGEIVDMLLANHPTLDIFEASAVGRTKRVEELAKAGADVEAKSPDGFTPLHLAAFFGNLGTVKALLKRGARVDPVSENDLGVRPLNSAVAGPHPEIVRVLLEHGADPNEPERTGFSPLHVAAENSDADSIRLLLGAGADPTRRSKDDRSPADLARERGRDDLVAMLSNQMNSDTSGRS